MAKPVIIIKVTSCSEDLKTELKRDMLSAVNNEYHVIVVQASFIESISISGAVNTPLHVHDSIPELPTRHIVEAQIDCEMRKILKEIKDQYGDRVHITFRS